MKIGILSRRSSLYSTSRLVEAAKEAGHEVHVVDYLRCYMNITSHRPQVLFAGKPLDFDAIIPRIGASHTFYGTAVVRQFEMMGVFPANESQAITRSRDKLRSLQLMARAGIGMPVTGFANSTKDVDGLIEIAGGTPLVMKLLEGTQGVGVVLAETHKAAESVIAAFRQLNANILVQEFISESAGTDIRAFVVGGKVVASMLRKGPPGEFRSNLHRGGSASRIKLTPEERSTAVRAAKVMGLNVAGVDMLEGKDGPQVMEVNSSPGLQGIEAATKVDIADAIIEHLEEQADFTEFDIRQRLTVAKGYGIAEFQLSPKTGLVGRTVESSGLRELDVQVLSITRGSVILPNPRPSEELRLGDTLLCFGKQLALKTLLPPPRRAKKTTPPAGDGAPEG